MGGRLTTSPSSTSPSSSTTTQRPTASNPSANSNPTRTHSNHHYQQQQQQQQVVHHHHRSNSSHHHHSHGLFGNNSGNSNSRHRTASTNIDPLAATTFNFNLLRYVGLEHESDDQSSDDDSPQAHRRLQHFIITLRDVPCPVCNKTIPSDLFEKHILHCLSKPRIDYNEDVLTEDKDECVICLDDLLAGQKIARLPCLCIYHKRKMLIEHKERFAQRLFIENPAMCTTDIISSFTRHAYSFVSFELGYFVFDSIDNIRNLSGRHTFEILLHHIIIIGCFGISLYLGRYIGYCVISLFIEINSIFLHLRQLFLFSNKSKRDQIYRINNIINLGTFVVFRFGVVTVMTVWLIMNRSNVPLILSFIGHLGLLIMTIINGYLLYRLIRSDYSVKHQ
ncbi:unnamed protein product [Rotaria socialis]|uniref:RING-type E3 ubiquitin transferase n=1 Tax=Rotaria socialis TaxID=392032 RepID=A0A821F756_9BILA|nr:unnamed protein product [Rotaria socialis]